MTLQFKIRHQTLYRQDRYQDIVAGSKGFVKCHFRFSCDWDGLIKTALFQTGRDIWTESLDEENECYIPEYILLRPGEFKVWLNGKTPENDENENIVEVTTDYVKIPIKPS